MSVNLSDVFTSTRKPETPRPKIIFSTPNYSHLVDRMVAESPDSLTKGETEHKLFPDGEIYNRFITDVSRKDIVLVGGTHTADDLMQLFYLASGLVDSGCHYLWIIIPFYGYSTMERAVKSGEVITAKFNSKMLSSISKPGSGAEFILLDLHVETICGFFENGWRAVHLQGRPIILQMISTCRKECIANLNAVVLGSTDAGRAKHIESLAGDLQIEPFVLLKHRSENGQTKVTATSMGSGNSIEGKNVIIYDDMIRTGGSLIEACKAYYAAGAISISVITTHGVFAGDAVERLKSYQSGGERLINCIWATDSHPNAIKMALEHPDFIRLFSVSTMLSHYLNTH